MNARQIIALVILIALFVIAMVGNVYGTLHCLGPGVFGRFDYFVAMGLLIAQPCLLSIWCALGAQKTVVRGLVSMLMVFLLALVYAKVLENDGAPMEVTLIVFGFAIGCVVVVQVPLWIFRIYSQKVIALPSSGEPELGENQFGISYLLMVTTLVAILTVVGKAAVPESSLSSGPLPFSWFRLAIFFLFVAAFECVLSFLILVVVFNQKRRLFFLLLLILFLLTAPFGFIEGTRVSGVLSRFTIDWWSLEVISKVFGFVWSLAATNTIVLAVYYRIGYRLMAAKNSKATIAHGLQSPTNA